METRSAIIRRKGEIIYLRFKPDAFVELDETKEIIEALLSHYKDKPLCVYTDASELFSITPESKKAFADKTLNSRIYKNAVYSPSIGVKLIGNFFINVFKPGFPVRLFSNETEALKWLEKKK